MSFFQRPFAACAALSCVLLASPALAVTNLATNPGFEDLDEDSNFGDGWGAFGAASFNEFFGPGNGHASLFPDTAGNIGGVFQVGIPAVEGQLYQFDLLDTRIESNFDANLEFGIEFYAADDTTQLGANLVSVDAAARLALPGNSGGVNGAVFSTTATAPVGAAFVRPIVQYDGVNIGYLQQSQANVFVFDSFLSEVPAPGGNLLKNPGFGEDIDLAGDALGDVWGSFGSTGFNDFFAGNAHASVFADTAGNQGGFFQQSILGDESKTYEFELVDVRIEENFDADLFFGLEYYGADDATKLGESLVPIDTTTRGDGLSYSMQASPVAGTVYVRPFVQFDNVNIAYLAQSQANAFIFETSFSEVTAGIPGDFDNDGDVDDDDFGVFAGAFGGAGPLGDFDNDGDVDDDDFGVFAGNFGTGVSATSVPEPSGALIAAVGCFAFLGRRVS